MSDPTGIAAKAKAAGARNADTANLDHGRDPRSRYDMVHPAGEQAEELSPSDARPQGAQFASTDVPPRGAFDSAQAAAAGGDTEQAERGPASDGTPGSSLGPSQNAFGGGSAGQGVRGGLPGFGADARVGPPENAGPPSDVPGNGPPPGRGDGGKGEGQPNLSPVKILDDGARVDENAEAGTVAATLEVIDPNRGDTHELRVVGDSPFEVVGNELRLREGAELDFESQRVYEVTVEATDSAGNTYQQVIPVKIGDVNEAPTDIGLDGQSVAENSAGGTVVGTLSALDPDFDDSASYEIVDEGGGKTLSQILLDNGQTYARPFEGEDSGKQGTGLRLVSEGRFYDGEGEAQAAVWRVRNAGDEAQEVTLDILGGGGERTVEVPANSELFLTTEGIGTAKLLFGGKQLDVKAAGKQDFGDGFGATVIGGGEPSPFEIVDGKLVLRESAELDYEGQQAYEVSVKATDEGGLSTTKNFTIDVTDVLEAPEVTASATTGAEDKPLDLAPLIDIATGGQAGALSVQIAGVPEGATLSAGQDNGDGTWSLAPSDLDGLTLTPPENSGDDFTLNVTATMTGAGGETASTTAKLPVSLDPVADAPKLALAGGDLSEIVLRVAADSWKGDPNLRLEVDGETIGNWKVSADHGAGEWETIRVSGDFGEDGPQQVKVGFTNDAYGGTPDTDRNLYVDRIEVNGKTYEAEGEGVDYGNREAQEAMKWAGKLTFDTSDNGGPNAGLAGDEDTAIALDLSAALADVDGSESLSLTLAGLPEGAQLSAGQNNGDGTWSLAPDDLDGLALTPPQDFNGNFTLQVTATATEAANGDAAATTLLVPVEVAPVNDAPTTPTLGFVIPENAEGALAGMISASDPDKGDTLDFTVSDERFEVKDGVLKLKDGESLDYEAEPFVKLSVTATDSHGASASQHFTVNVWDVNEAPTGIEPGGFTVEENAPGGTLLATLDAIDPDTGDTHSYEVLDHYADGIEVRGNQLFLKDGVDIDYEEGAEHAIPIKVTDSAGNSHVETVTATIKDVNEAPQGENIPDQKAGPEQPLDMNVSGYFSDEDNGDTLTYSMQGPDWLSIDPQTGQISSAPQPTEQTLEMKGGLYDLPTGGKLVLDTEMLSSFAGFDNSIGYYLADEDGKPLSGEIVNINVKDFDAKQTEIDLSAEPGAKSLGLFLIPNGANRAGSLDDGAKVTFAEKGGGWEAVINDGGQTIQTWFSDAALNSDGFDHLTDNKIEGNLNWEDLRGGGDKNFGDVNMTAKLTAIAPDAGGESQTVTITATDEGGLSASQTFAFSVVEPDAKGQPGEVLLGTPGNDRLKGGDGDDVITTGGGSDTVVFTGGNDTITDFDTNAQDKGEAGNQDENSFDTLRLKGTDFDGKYSSVDDFVDLVRTMQTDDSEETEAFAAPGSDDLTLSFARYEDGQATHSVTLEGVLGKDGLRAALEADDIEGQRQPDEPRDPFEGGDIVRGAARVGGPEGFRGNAVDGAGRSEAAEFLMFDSGEDESAFDGARGGWIDAIETGAGAGHAYGFDPRGGDWTSQIDNAGRPKPEDKSRVLSDEADPSVSPAEDEGGAGTGAQEINKMDWS